MYLGKVICIPDTQKAAERDEAFFSGKAPPPPAFPSLTDGILHRDDDGVARAPAGLLSPHGTVCVGNQTGRFDDIVGLGFVLVSRSLAAESALGARQRAFLDEIGAKRVVVVASGAAAGRTALLDLDGKFIPYMAQHGIHTMLVRPDFYVYGVAAQASEVNQLVDDLAADLYRHGVSLPARRELQAA